MDQGIRTAERSGERKDIKFIKPKNENKNCGNGSQSQ
jgi:hypothetical protein